MAVNEKVLRKLCFHYINYTVAADADMTLHQLQQYVAGNFQPTLEQIQRLANRVKLRDESAK